MEGGREVSGGGGGDDGAINFSVAFCTSYCRSCIFEDSLMACKSRGGALVSTRLRVSPT